MGTVTNTIELPGQTPASSASVKIRLDTSPAFQIATDDEIAGTPPLAVDGNGLWTANLVPNAEITPANTRYEVIQRVNGVERTYKIIVPVGAGPFNAADILAEPLAPLPTTIPSNERAVAELTTGAGPFAVDGFAIVPVPGLVVTAPVLTRPCYILADLWMDHSAANVSMGCFIAPVGSTLIGQQIAGSLGFAAAISKDITTNAWARLAAGVTGNFQSFVYSDTPGNINVIANSSSKARIAVLEV